MIVEFTDPRLVAIYETVNPYAPATQPHFYAQLAAEMGAVSIVDLGCGTGLITRDLAGQGYRVIGIDPAAAMIDIARHRPNGEVVRWIVGDATSVGTPAADMAIMTGHVAQFFLDDHDWRVALTALHAGLRPGGMLAFETRNPLAREWERWTPEFRSSVVDPVVGRIDTWSDTHDVTDGIVSYTIHYLFIATGDEILAPCRLRFRTLAELTESLVAAGFAIQRIHGDWDRRPADAMTSELIVVATR